MINFDFKLGEQSKKGRTREPKEEISLGPTVRDGEHVFGVAHIFASFNDTFIVSSPSLSLTIYSCYIFFLPDLNLIL